jgi:hypothetical protein
MSGTSLASMMKNLTATPSTSSPASVTGTKTGGRRRRGRRGTRKSRRGGRGRKSRRRRFFF